MTDLPCEAQELVCNGSRSSGRGNPWKGRTHCDHGHEYTAENTQLRVDSSGRRCRECQRQLGRRWYATQGKALRAGRRQSRPNNQPDPARALMQVAKHPDLSNRTHGSDLPPSWRTLERTTS